jgi:inorganic pyrophosphatase
VFYAQHNAFKEFKKSLDMNPVHDVPRGTPHAFNTIIEIPAGTRNKYEVDKQTGLLKLDRVIYSSVMYPADYGFIPQTHWDDGDPLDVLVLSRYPIVPMTIVPVRPIGVMQMIDDNEQDNKIIAVVATDPNFNDYHDITDLEQHLLKEIKHFFEIYKDLQDKKVQVEQFLPKADALKIIQKSFDLYDEQIKPKLKVKN